MMNLKTFFLLFVFVSIAFATSAALGVSSYTVSPSSIKPGSTGKAIITLNNGGDDTASQVTISYTPTLAGFTGGSYSQQLFVGDIAGHSSTIVTIPFIVPADLPARVYSFTFDIYFQGTNSGSKTSGGSIPVSVTNPPILSFITENVSKPVIGPSSSFIIYARIKNDGGPASNLQLIYPTNSQFSSSGGNNLFVGSIDSGKVIDFQIPFTAASSISEGVYSIPLNYSFDDSNGISSTGQASFGPIIAAQLSNELTARIETKNLVQPGGVADIDVILTNLQDQPLSNLIVSLSSNANYVVLDGNDKVFDSLGAKSEVRIPFKVGISPSSFSSFYPVSINISYVSPLRGGSSVVKTGGIQISGASSFEIVSSTTPSPLTADSQLYTLSLKISNTGNSPVRALNVKIDGDFLDFVGSNGDYIGALNLDDFSTVSLQTGVKKGITAGVKNVTVHLTYKDTYNRQYSDDEVISIHVYSTDEAKSLSGTSSSGVWISIIIILVIASIVWFVIRRRNSKA